MIVGTYLLYFFLVQIQPHRFALVFSKRDCWMSTSYEVERRDEDATAAGLGKRDTHGWVAKVSAVLRKITVAKHPKQSWVAVVDVVSGTFMYDSFCP